MERSIVATEWSIVADDSDSSVEDSGVSTADSIEAEEENGDNDTTAAPAPDDPLASYYEAYADQFLDFINTNPTTYHVVSHFKSLLENNGFKSISQNKAIAELDAGFYYTCNGDQSLVAFVIGGKWSPGKGSCFVASHCDALSVKVNPRGSLKSRVDGYDLIGVAPYSGSLNSNWLNRDLGLAGSVLVQTPQGVQRTLINSAPLPIAVIPSLAPHFGVDTAVYNKQTQAVPVFAHRSDDELVPTEEELGSKFFARHSLRLLRYICALAGVSLSSIVDFDLDLVDVQPSCRGGVNREFIFSGCLDDRLCAFDSIYGLIEYSQQFLLDKDISTSEALNGVYLANNEEVGSLTSTGACGGFLIDTLRSVVAARCRELPVSEAVAQLTTNTVLLSSDVTHALNPNFKEAYLENNFPLPNTGPSIKFDSNAHVLSDSLGKEFLTRIVADLDGVKLQQFHIRNDSRSGGTIGPIMSSSQRGVNGARMIIDVGLPILSMHSIRSIAGYKDVGMGVRFFKQVFCKWRTVAREMDGKRV
ncbi:uncharacterized protein LODBEIA_P57520 [Lodderomyces beijingensis]|uniref:Aspartyl aminopeptidase n=1 Tax=Lodderomyces beijingensis TaxID=1775926 RepID=A0ABP0ZC57_9ASCO